MIAQCAGCLTATALPVILMILGGYRATRNLRPENR